MDESCTLQLHIMNCTIVTCTTKTNLYLKSIVIIRNRYKSIVFKKYILKRA